MNNKTALMGALALSLMEFPTPSTKRQQVQNDHARRQQLHAEAVERRKRRTAAMQLLKLQHPHLNRKQRKKLLREQMSR